MPSSTINPHSTELLIAQHGKVGQTTGLLSFTRDASGTCLARSGALWPVSTCSHLSHCVRSTSTLLLVEAAVLRTGDRASAPARTSRGLHLCGVVAATRAIQVWPM
eukprot:6026219-Amphidinium_carterae.1